MDQIQKFGIVSLIIFSITISLTSVLYTDCILNNDSCTNTIFLSHFLHLMIISAGLIGITYAIIMLKSMEKTEIKINKDLEDFLKDDSSSR